MINEKIKYTHIIESCSQLLKAYNYVILEKFTGDTLSSAYWRLREGNGLVTYQDRKILVATSKQITKIRRFFSSPIALDENSYKEVRNMRENLLERLESYRDWLAQGSAPVYLTQQADHEYNEYTLEMAVRRIGSEVIIADIEKQKKFWRSVDINKIIACDRIIYEKVRKEFESAKNRSDALMKIAEKYWYKVLPKDKVWQIRTDIERRSSKTANINLTMNWICDVPTKSEGHDSVLEENEKTIAEFIEWKTKIKEQKKKGVHILDDCVSVVRNYIGKIIVPEYSQEENTHPSVSEERFENLNQIL